MSGPELVLVPKEPTLEMLVAAEDAVDELAGFYAKHDSPSYKAWRAFLTAAPQPAPAQEPVNSLKLALKRLGELNRDDEAGIRIVIANAIAALSRSQPAPAVGEWQPIETAPKDGTVVEVVGRYLDATAGFPRYAHFYAGQWHDCSRHVDPIVAWAWRQRTDWPHSPLTPEA